MSNTNKTIVLFLLVATPSAAWCYIDPGTGMAFASGIGAMILGFFTVILGGLAVTFKKWTAFLKRIFKRSKSS